LETSGVGSVIFEDTIVRLNTVTQFIAAIRRID
jgi:hypothetical protein